MLRCRVVRSKLKTSFIVGISRATPSHCRSYHGSIPSHQQTKLNFPDKLLTLPKFKFQSVAHTIQSITSNLDELLESGTEVTINGWINNKTRKISKKLVFGNLRDINGNTAQLLGNEESVISSLRSASSEDSVSVSGYVTLRTLRKDEEFDPNNKKWDLIVTKYQTLNHADVAVSQLESLKKTPELYPAQYRYLQLRLPFYQQALKKRSLASSIVRNTLIEADFTEVETPLLFKSTPEGAREFLVPTRKPSLFYALPQSPQQYKQLLMASGVKNYFQIAKCFRDEDLRADRQPEFTQIDMEMSFANGKDVRRQVEKLVNNVWEKVAGVPILIPSGDDKLVKSPDGTFPNLTYQYVLENYGIDKPDLRSSLKFENLSQFFSSSSDEFSVFEVCVLRGAFDTSEKCKFPSLLNDTKEYKNRKPIVIPIKNEEDIKSWYLHFERYGQFNGDIEGVHKLLDLKPGDIIAGSNRAEVSYENPTPLGRFRQLAIQSFPEKWRRSLPEGLEVPQDKVFVGSWIVDFPLFSPIETSNESAYPQYDYQRHTSTHHPFTMAHLDDYELLASEPLKVRGQHYDLVVNGVELGGGSTRIHDTDLQNYIFKEILGIKDPERLFGHLLHAFKMGCPPHAGLAIGFDRMCAMLIGSSSIRDVVAFPKNASGADMVVESPSNVSDDVLKEYYIERRVEK